MNEVLNFMGDVNTPVAVATIDNNNPCVRFFSFKMYENGKLYFITSKEKEVYKQLSSQPKVAMCTLPNDQMEWIRIEASVTFVEDLELNRKAFQLLPLLEQAYQTPENKQIALFYLQNIVAVKHSITGNKEILSLD